MPASIPIFLFQPRLWHNVKSRITEDRVTLSQSGIRSCLMALFLVVLSAASMVATPVSMQNHPRSAETPVQAGSQNSAGTGEMTAAIISLQSGQGPLSSRMVTCSPTGLSAYCQTSGGQAASASSTPTWSQFNPLPGARQSGSMVYDAADGYTVFVSGDEFGTFYGDTWKFAAGSWTNINSSIAPPPRAYGSIAYDANDGYVVLFGGRSASGPSMSDTWKFLGGTWTNLTPSAHPPARAGASLTYDAADRYVLLFGGYSGSNFLGDSWKFVGGSWANITSSAGPSARVFASITYDTA